MRRCAWAGWLMNRIRWRRERRPSSGPWRTSWLLAKISLKRTCKGVQCLSRIVVVSSPSWIVWRRAVWTIKRILIPVITHSRFTALFKQPSSLLSINSYRFPFHFVLISSPQRLPPHSPWNFQVVSAEILSTSPSAIQQRGFLASRMF